MLPCFLVPLVGVLGLGAREDWPQWGGPARTGVSRESGWSSEGRPEPLWKQTLGIGYSSVAVAGQRVYTLGFDRETEHDVIYCLDALSGEIRWVQGYPAKILDLYHGGGTLTTPAVDGERVYVSEREGWLHCLAAEDGEILWERQVKKELGLDLPQWGFSGSPVVLGDALVLNYGKVVAFDKRSGEPRWSSAKHYGDAYSTPVDLDLGGRPALAVFGGSGLALLGAADGGELAFAPWKTKYDVNAMTPVVLEQRVFISSGYDKGCALLDLSQGEPKVLWESKVMRNTMSGALPWQGHLYGFDEKVLKCIDLEGEERWRERGLGQGALTIADGRLIAISEEGEVVVAEATPERYRELSRAKVFDGGVCWTVPVLSGGIVYVRNHAGELAALDHRPR
jgi:outer membrane protein assembly factor BamB